MYRKSEAQARKQAIPMTNSALTSGTMKSKMNSMLPMKERMFDTRVTSVQRLKRLTFSENLRSSHDIFLLFVRSYMPFIVEGSMSGGRGGIVPLAS